MTPQSTGLEVRSSRDTDIPDTDVVAENPGTIVVPPDCDIEEPSQLDNRGDRESSDSSVPIMTRIFSLERLRQQAPNDYISPDFLRDQLAASRADSGKVYDPHWSRWVRFSKEKESGPGKTSFRPEWDISIPKFTSFLQAIRDGFGGIKPNVPTYIKRHSTMVLLTLELAIAMVQSILPGIHAVRSTNFHSSIWKGLERLLATSKRRMRSNVSTTVLEEDRCWDPIRLLQFWHNFPSAAALQKAKWPATLITKLIRAKAIVILQVELAARQIRRCHNPIMGFYYSAFSNRNNDSGVSPNISPTVQPHLRV